MVFAVETENVLQAWALPIENNIGVGGGFDLAPGATLARSAAIGQRAIAISAGPPLRRGALRGAHGKPGRARALAWNRVCGAIGSEFSDARAVELKCADRATKFYTANFIELGSQ